MIGSQLKINSLISTAERADRGLLSADQNTNLQINRRVMREDDKLKRIIIQTCGLLQTVFNYRKNTNLVQVPKWLTALFRLAVEFCEIEIHEAQNDLWSGFHLNFDISRTLFRHHCLFPLNFTTQIEFSPLFQVGLFAVGQRGEISTRRRSLVLRKLLMMTQIWGSYSIFLFNLHKMCNRCIFLPDRF